MNQGKNYIRFTYRSVLNLAFVAVMIILGSSCNKDFPNKLAIEYKNDTLGINYKERKVLYLILDGINGAVLQNLEPANIAALFRNSVYSYGALTDFEDIDVTNANGWANMLTGVGVHQHGVKTEDFSGNDLENYQSIFSRLKAKNPKMRTVSLASSGIFNTNLAMDATVKNTFENDDEAVYQTLISELKDNDPGFLVAQFHGAELAGKNSGYTVNSAEYVAAIQKLDGYLGEVLKALSKRNQGKEDWLVVLASNKGGGVPTGPIDNTAFGDPTRNNFIAFYNPKFITQFIPKPESNQVPYVGVAPNFTATTEANRNGAVISDPNRYNFGTNDFTFQMKIRVDHPTSNVVTIGGKRAEYAPAHKGWVMYISGGRWGVNMGNGSTQNTYTAGGSSIIADKIWHTVTFKVYLEAGVRWIKYFNDGSVGNVTNINTYYKNLDSPAPLTLGRIPYSTFGATDVLIKEVQLFNTALSDDVIIANVRKTSIDSSHPAYANLVGYWPCDEGQGNVILEKTGKGSNFTISGVSKWKPFNDYSPFIDGNTSGALYKNVPNSVDIPFQIYQWMGVNVPESWGLIGKSWKIVYSDTKL